MPAVRVALSMPDVDEAIFREGLRRAEQALQHGNGGSPTIAQDLAAALNPSQQPQLRRLTGELHFLLAGARLRQADALSDATALSDSTARQSHLHDAQQQNRWACQLQPTDGLSAVLADQQTEILARLGSVATAGPAESAQQRSRQPSDPSAADLYFALQSLRQGRYAAAVPQLEAACRAAPFDLSLWLLWGNALAGCGRLSEAEGCYNTCVQQWSDSYLGWWYRGLCRLESQKYREAEADFQQVLQRQPDFLPALINRGLARREQGQLADAAADLTGAVRRGATQTRLYFLRSQLRRRLADPAGADADWQQGLELEPTDELSWIERGLARLKSDPALALADFQQAVRINPVSRRLAEYCSCAGRAIAAAAAGD